MVRYINVLLLCGISLFVCSCSTNVTDRQEVVENENIDAPSPQGLTARQVIELIKKNVNCKWNEKGTVDTFKAGDPDTPVTGIVTTGFATMDILKRAKAAGANLIIAHEPTFYDHFDETKKLKGDKVVAAKLAFIENNNLVVWRFHDHIHRHSPDMITLGMAKACRWEDYYVAEKNYYLIPETTARKLAAELKKQLNASVVRVVGDPDLKVRRAAMVLGAPGSAKQIRMLQRDDIDIVIAGESSEWETTEYVRDAVSSGKQIGLIMLGHNNSEEGAMKYCQQWLKTFITEIPIEFIPAGDPFWTP